MSYIKSIRMRPSTWNRLRERLDRDYPRSTMIIRYKMKQDLGFLVREHTEWRDLQPRVVVYLDFYNELQQTMFLLKYSEYLESSSGDSGRP